MRPALLSDSNGSVVELAGTDAHHALHGRDEDLAVADLARARHVDDGVHATIHVLGADHDLDLHLGQEVHHVLGTAVKLGMALLAAKALDLGDGQAVDARSEEHTSELQSPCNLVCRLLLETT